MKQSIFIALIVSMQLLGQLLIQLLLVRIVGVGPETDAYLAAQAAPMVLGSIVITAMQSVWLPRLAVISSNSTAWRREQATAHGQAAVLGGALMLGLAGSVTLWLPILYPEFSVQQQQDAINYSVVLFLAAIFSTQSALLTVALRARDRFVLAESIALVGTLFALFATYLALPKFGLVAVAWIQAGRAAVVFLVQMHIADWPKVSIMEGLRCRSVWQNTYPLLFGGGIYKTTPIVDRYIAGLGPAGGLTMLALAQTVIMAVVALLEQAICMPAMSRISRKLQNERVCRLGVLFKREVLQILAIVVSLGAMLVALKPSLLFIAGLLLKMEGPDAEVLWVCVLILLLYALATTIGRLVTTSFYASGDMKTTTRTGVINFMISTVLKFLLFDAYGITGLAIGVAIFPILNVVVLSLIKISRNERSHTPLA